MTADVKPITADERAARIEKAQQLMAHNKIGAIYLEGGSSMFYFTGVRWGLSERPFVCVIPAKGEAGVGVPRLRRGTRARAGGGKTAEVRVWQEDESPVSRRSPASSRIAAPQRAASASKNGCATSSTAA